MLAWVVVNPYARLLASLLRLTALGMIFLAGLGLFLDYLRRQTGREEEGPGAWSGKWLVLYRWITA